MAWAEILLGPEGELDEEGELSRQRFTPETFRQLVRSQPAASPCRNSSMPALRSKLCDIRRRLIIGDNADPSGIR